MARRFKHWTAAVAIRGEERRAAHHVERLGFNYYLPEILRPNSIGEFCCRRLLFPGYIFIKLRQNWERLLHIRGLRRILYIDEIPLTVQQREIEALRRLEDDKGFIRMGPRICVGDMAKIGPLGGIYKGLTLKIVKASGDQRTGEISLVGCHFYKTFDERVFEEVVAA